MFCFKCGHSSSAGTDHCLQCGLKYEFESIVRALESTGEYRVLRKFKPLRQYHLDDGATRQFQAVVVDVETTGLEPAEDAIIQLAIVPLKYCPDTGRIFSVGEHL